MAAKKKKGRGLSGKRNPAKNPKTKKKISRALTGLRQMRAAFQSTAPKSMRGAYNASKRQAAATRGD